ncbi:TonB-dependent receptor [Mucilaginibacter sp.]|uniref:TonB-dependent receptor domain-containing protein n=1 Tax=Mucilaginibacter sp. TaxID=1882438 RepID=UPI003263C83F
MKIIYLLVLLTLCTYTAFAQSQKITISAVNIPIKTVFDQIQAKSDYYILYSDEVVPDSMKVSIQADKLAVSAILDQILSGKNLTYSVSRKGMIVIAASKNAGNSKTKGTNIETSINGHVNNQNGVPCSYTTVALAKNTQVLSGCITDNNGNFHMVYPFKTNETYQLKITALGFKAWSQTFVYPDTAFTKNIRLTEESHTLNTVSIVAERPLVTRKADRYIVNVEGSFLANGFSGLEVLQKSPGIWVNSDGSIRIKGNQSVMVMINDVVQRMSTDDLAEYLRALKSESISKIEVISNPPSEFEASGTGGIIHIQLKKSRSDGMLTNLYAQYRQQNKRPFISSGGLIDSKIKNFYLFGNAFVTSDESTYVGTYHIIYPGNNIYDSYTIRNNHNERLQYRLGMAYDLPKNQSISLQTTGNVSKLEQSFDTDIGFNNLSGYTTSGWLRKPVLNASTFNYVWKIDSLGSMLKVISDYAYSEKTEQNLFTGAYNDPTKNSIFRTNTPNTTNIFSFQTDYTKALKNKTEFKAGVKYAGANRNNELLNEDYLNNNWVVNQPGSNQFLYDEHLYMAYTSFEKTLNKTSIKAGLRAEETSIDGNSLTSNEQFTRNYLNLFPSLFINHVFDAKKNEAVYFSYSRRLQRPSYKELNPYRLQVDNFIVSIGNPDLQPQYTHSFELGADFFKGWSANVYFSATTNTIAQFAQPIQNNVLEYQTRNFSNSTEYGTNLNIPIRVNSWWNMNNSVSLYHLSYLYNNIRNTQTTFSAKTAQTLVFKKLFNLDVYTEYRSPYVNGNTEFTYVLYTEVGLSRKIMNNKGRIQLYFDDIFNVFKEQEYTNYNNTQIYFYQKRPTRTASIQFSYSITSGKKFTNKKVDQSNTEEKNRL